MKRRTFLGSLLAAPAAAALARTLPKTERAAPAEAAPASEPPGVDWDLGDYSGRSHPDKGVVSVEIGGVTYSLLAYD